ncbi:MAG: nucleotide exchange factor GrpE [Prevotellaceae bacterium]|jgi:molecular chaperone GrpE|nr:nucleotide exchange factor GrpE [Prevotellaceae bacterium]
MKKNQKETEVKIEEQPVVEQTVESTDNEQITEKKTDENAEQSEIVDFEQKYNDLNDSYLRLMAEYDNYRRRTMKEKTDIVKTAGEKILIDILPVIDDFERGLKAISETSDINAAKEGIELIYSKFQTFLAQNGVKVIETENQNFDVDFHEAITAIPAPSENLKGKIIDCVSKGYTLNDRVIRFSKVVVGE